jgi:hypothetical protein
MSDANIYELSGKLCSAHTEIDYLKARIAKLEAALDSIYKLSSGPDIGMIRRLGYIKEICEKTRLR